MATYLGNPSQHIIDWIKTHSKPMIKKETHIKFIKGMEGDYLIEGVMDCPALVAAGLMPSGSGTDMPPSWNKDPVEVEIGSAVTSIGDDAFWNCGGLTSVSIPSSVTRIMVGAFYGCNSLTSVTIGKGVTSIGSEAFSDCSRLTSVTIPDSVTSIGTNAFAICNSLTSVTITSNGGDAAKVKQMMIDAGAAEDITWNMPN